jgi:hypothetical protein
MAVLDAAPATNMIFDGDKITNEISEIPEVLVHYHQSIWNISFIGRVSIQSYFQRIRRRGAAMVAFFSQNGMACVWAHPVIAGTPHW